MRSFARFGSTDRDPPPGAPLGEAAAKGFESGEWFPLFATPPDDPFDLRPVLDADQRGNSLDVVVPRNRELCVVDALVHSFRERRIILRVGGETGSGLDVGQDITHEFAGRAVAFHECHQAIGKCWFRHRWSRHFGCSCNLVTDFRPSQMAKKTLT